MGREQLLREFREAAARASLPAYAKPVTDLVESWVGPVIDPAATLAAADAYVQASAPPSASPRATRVELWAGLLRWCVLDVQQPQEDLSVWAERFHVRMALGDDARVRYAAARDVAALLRSGEGPLFSTLDADERRRAKKTVVAKKRKGLAAFEAHSLVQQVIDEVETAEADEVLSDHEAARAAVAPKESSTDELEEPSTKWGWSDDEEDSKFTSLCGGLSTVSTMSGGDAGSSWGTFGSGSQKLEAAFKKASVTPSEPSDDDEPLRTAFYKALRGRDPVGKIGQMRAQASSDGQRLLCKQIDSALQCLRYAEWCRAQLWQCFHQSPTFESGFPAADGPAAERTAHALRQGQLCVRGLPQALAKSWDPRTSGDVLGRVSMSVPLQLLSSLVEMVEGRAGGKATPAIVRSALAV
jgi:hypothetical protein